MPSAPFSPAPYIVPAIVATAAASAAVAHEEEAARGRRISHAGHDQLLLKVRGSVEATGKAISTLYDNWFWDSEDETLMKHNGREFSFIGACITGLIMVVVMMFSMIVFFPYGEGIPWNPLTGVMLILAVSGAVGSITVFFPTDDEIDYINIREHGNGCTVLLKRYDGDGRRNLDEDEILHIIDALKKNGLEGGADEV